MNATAPSTPLSPWATGSWRDAPHDDRLHVSERPTLSELLEEVVPLVFVVPVAGPPVILLLGPLLLVVLLLIPPTAVLFTLALVVVARGLFVALAAVVASPYLLVRHLRARRGDYLSPVGGANREERTSMPRSPLCPQRSASLH